MRFRVLTTLVVLLALLAGAGCGASAAAGGPSSDASPVNTAAIGSTTANAQISASYHGRAWKAAFTRVHVGYSPIRVEDLLGPPRHRVLSGASRSCWFYGSDTSLLTRGGVVCFHHHRVSFVESPSLGAAQYVVTAPAP